MEKPFPRSFVLKRDTDWRYIIQRQTEMDLFCEATTTMMAAIRFNMDKMEMQFFIQQFPYGRRRTMSTQWS